MSRVPLAAVLVTLDAQPAPDVLARARVLDAEAQRCAYEAQRSRTLRTGTADAWESRAAERRAAALRCLEAE